MVLFPMFNKPPNVSSFLVVSFLLSVGSSGGISYCVVLRSLYLTFLPRIELESLIPRKRHLSHTKIVVLSTYYRFHTAIPFVFIDLLFRL